jgi:hypothetical protein
MINAQFAGLILNKIMANIKLLLRDSQSATTYTANLSNEKSKG